MPALIAVAGLGAAAPAAAASAAATRMVPATAYVANGSSVLPINTATNTTRKPIQVSDDVSQLLPAPDGRTVYAAGGGGITPITVATGKAGRLIPLHGLSMAAVSPDGRTLYAGSGTSVIPVDAATGKEGTPVPVGGTPQAIVFAPDSKTAYILTGSSLVPVNVAAGTAGQPVQVPAGGRQAMAITPGGKTVHVIGDGSGETVVIPIAASTGTPETPVETVDDTVAMALTPDGRTLYVVGDNNESDPEDSIVTPISTATDTALAAIPDPGNPGPIEITRAHCSRR